MDPDVVLRAARRAVARWRAANDEVSGGTAFDLVEAFEALDDWLRRGGFLPAAWTPDRAAPAPACGPPTVGELAAHLLGLPLDAAVHIDHESFAASGGGGDYVSLSHVLGEMEERRADAADCERAKTGDGDTFVLDPLELRAWGPFASDDEAERFIESDKYLASWCVVTTGAAIRRHLGAAYPPAAYHGTWPKES